MLRNILYIQFESILCGARIPIIYILSPRINTRNGRACCSTMSTAHHYSNARTLFVCIRTFVRACYDEMSARRLWNSIINGFRSDLCAWSHDTKNKIKCGCCFSFYLWIRIPYIRSHTEYCINCPITWRAQISRTVP